MDTPLLPLVAYRPDAALPESTLETIHCRPVASNVAPEYATVLAVGPEAVAALRTIKTEMETRFNERSLQDDPIWLNATAVLTRLDQISHADLPVRCTTGQV
jgi:hypothetical protein